MTHQTRYDLDREDLGEVLAGEPSYRVTQVWEGLYSHCTEPDDWSNVPKVLRSMVNTKLPAALNKAAESISDDGQILGTYLHGLFVAPEACQALLHWAGQPGTQAVDLDALRDQSLERLADAMQAVIAKLQPLGWP